MGGWGLNGWEGAGKLNRICMAVPTEKCCGRQLVVSCCPSIKLNLSNDKLLARPGPTRWWLAVSVSLMANYCVLSTITVCLTCGS